MKKIIILTCIAIGVFVLLGYPKPDLSSLNLSGKEATSDEIVVTSPQKGSKISSPVEVSGRARGSWYFEASAPVKVLSESGEELGQGFVTAQGEWMTSEFVDFKGTINLNPGNYTKGFLVFMNDNPSGDPERSRYVVVPVKF